MTLTDRLSASFLAALAVILAGFSTALYVLAFLSLHRSVEQRLEAALSTLAILAEDEPGGLDWERDERQLALGRDTGHDQVRWLILDEHGTEIDRSQNLGDPAVLIEPGSRRLDPKRQPWRVAQIRLQSKRLDAQRPRKARLSNTLVLSVGLPLEPVDRPLRSLAITLPLLSVALWGLTALVGRRLCRTALAPLTRMAATARDLGVDEPGRRLPASGTGDELQDLALAFNGVLDRLHEAIDRQSRFAGDASHQLRTPLTALIGQVDVALRRERTPEEYRLTLARVRGQSDRLRRIVEALLYLARADSEAGRPTFERFDLSEWVAEHLRRRRDERGEVIELGDVRADGPIVIHAQPALLAEVFDNLLDNARDHGRGDRPVEVQIRRERGQVWLVVQDHGRGIALDDLPRLFEPFYRTKDAQSAVPGGVGLGLSVAQRIMQSFGGRIDVESHLGAGSRFQLGLPETADPVSGNPNGEIQVEVVFHVEIT